MIEVAVGGSVSLVFTLVLTPFFCAWFRRLDLGQFYRADTPTAHILKRGTPSMGGVVFLSGTTTGYAVAHLVGPDPVTSSGLLAIAMMWGIGAVGFLDDYLKVSRQNSIGLLPRYKITGIVGCSLAFSAVALLHHNPYGRTPASTALSFVRDLPIDPVKILGPVIGGAIVVAWFVLLINSTSNAVNLADGLDGLAAGASIMTAGSYIVIGYVKSTHSCWSATTSTPLDIPGCYQATHPRDLAVVAGCLVGSLIGFLWWNTTPAQIHMGDTGAFGIGGALAALAILSRTELLLVLTGGLFLTITAQVIVQRIYFKATHGRRIWRASPLHHHFEMLGWPEISIVVRFWLVAGIFVATGLGVFYVESLSRR